MRASFACPRVNSRVSWIRKRSGGPFPRRTLARAAERRARRALTDVGLDGPEAAIDIRDLRTLLESLRMACRTGWQTVSGVLRVDSKP